VTFMRSAGPRRCAVLLISVFLALPECAVAQDVLDPEFRSADDTEGADVIGTLTDSLKLFLIEHAFRIGDQDKTRRELGGNSGPTIVAPFAFHASGATRTLGG
jgi:hypothetical protein